MDRRRNAHALRTLFNAAPGRRWVAALGLAAASVLSVEPGQASELCGGQSYPFAYTDVAAVGAAFCPGIMEAYVTGISKGTTPTTFSPDETVTRVQMSTFLQRSVDQVLTRGSRRSALNQWWTPQGPNGLQLFVTGGTPLFCAADGENIWAANAAGNVYQIQASTGHVTGPWTGAPAGAGILPALGKVWVADESTPGALYVINPATAPTAATLVVSGLGSRPYGIAFDGTDIWIANVGTGPDTGSVSKVDPVAQTILFTVSTGFNRPVGILYDGASIWVTDFSGATLLKLNSSGAIVQTVNVGAGPNVPVFDGANIWVPNLVDSSVTVVQASTGSIVATISSNGANNLNEPFAASFDGERILIANGGGSVTLFKAADLSLIGNVVTPSGSEPTNACSDGINFWISDAGLAGVLRF